MKARMSTQTMRTYTYPGHDHAYRARARAATRMIVDGHLSNRLEKRPTNDKSEEPVS